MTYREKFCIAMARRGYEVENLGLLTVLTCATQDGGMYTAVHFFNKDGSVNRDEKPISYFEK